MKIPKEYETNSVEHRYGGNDWAVVQSLPDEWSRAVYIGKGEVGSQILLLWTNIIKSDNRPLNPDLLPKINAIRAKLASGEYIVENTRLVKATPFDTP